MALDLPILKFLNSSMSGGFGTNVNQTKKDFDFERSGSGFKEKFLNSNSLNSYKNNTGDSFQKTRGLTDKVFSENTVRGKFSKIIINKTLDGFEKRKNMNSNHKSPFVQNKIPKKG